jgi:hypothetical protein
LERFIVVDKKLVACDDISGCVRVVTTLTEVPGIEVYETRIESPPLPKDLAIGLVNLIYKSTTRRSAALSWHRKVVSELQNGEHAVAIGRLKGDLPGLPVYAEWAEPKPMPEWARQLIENLS